MTLRHIVPFAGVATILFATSAMAQSPASKFEITPFVGYRIGGDFNEQDGDGRVELNESSTEGITFNIKANENGQYELLYVRQRTDANILGFLPNDSLIDIEAEHLQFGGTYLFDGENTRPFIALTLGLSHFDPEFPGASSESFFSASLGGGVQLNASKRLCIRLEARAFATFVDDDSRIFCSSIDGSGSCLIVIDGNLLTQWEARAGLVFRF